MRALCFCVQQNENVERGTQNRAVMQKKNNSAVDVFVSKTLCLLLYDKFVFHVMQFYSDEYANIELTERSQCEVDAAGEGMSQTPFLYAKHSVWSG